MNSAAVSKSNYSYIELMHLWFTYAEGHFTYPLLPFSSSIPICSFTAMLWPFPWEQFWFTRSSRLKKIVKICPL